MPEARDKERLNECLDIYLGQRNETKSTSRIFIVNIEEIVRNGNSDYDDTK